MTLTAYLSFLAFACFIAVSPGPDFAVVMKNSVARGRKAGMYANLGIASGNVVHGAAAALGVGALIVQSQTLFNVLRWAGVCYLAYLGVHSLVAACRGRYRADAEPAADAGTRRALHGWSQGFLSNITNPKALALFLSVLPQFMAGGDGSVAWPVLMAASFIVVDVIWLALVVTFLHRVRAWIRRRAVRRAVDAGAGFALVGFGAKLAADA
ncbi:MAG: LysE family translocator [Stackebrandtia sp.]